MNIMHKLAEDAIDIILAECDDWIDDNQYHDFEGDYDWSDDDMCTLYFRVDGKYIGSWDVDIADIEDVNTLDNISAEVEAAVSGMKRSEYVDDSGIDSRTGRKAGVPADFDGEDDEWDIENNKPFDSYYKESSSNIKENWQDDWVEPTIDPNPIDNINGLNIYKGTNQYGEEAYYLFLEDEDPEPGYEEWQAETLEIAREWASSYETVEADDFDDLYEYLTPGNIIRESYSKGIPSEILDMIKDSKRVRNAFIEIGLDPSKMIIDKVDKFHKNNPNYLPVEVYEYNLDDKYSDRSIYGGVGIKIGGYKDIYDSMPGAYVKKTKTIGIYEIDITKNIENNAIIGDKIELRATNKNDPKNQYLDRVSYQDPTIDKSGYFTVGNFKSKYGKDALTRRHDIMKGESVEADDFEDEVAPNAYNYIFKTLDKDYWDESDWSSIEDYDGDRCKVVSTEIQGPNFESSYHNIEFKDGTKFSAISGIHLQPVKKGYTKLKTESNGVSRNIPFTLDNFLQDVAQITGTISYLDIANFKYTEKDKASLNKLRSAWYDALDDDADDEVLQDIGRKVANLLKSKLKKIN